MLMQALDKFTVAARDYNEQVKAQYTDKGDIKNYFRASEVGQPDRKIIYSFFKHQIPTIPRSAKSLRQLANGDKVHERYQKLWEDMGVLISMEERLSSKDDEYLKEFEWSWEGHYDGLLDVNVLRAHAKGLCTVGYSINEDTEEYEVEVDIDNDYAEEIGIFNEDYVPVTMVADIKTMNPWGFKRVAQGNVAELRGYIDQITFYMYMLNTPYGSLYIEDKGSNDIVEVQVLWKDMHEGVEYTFDPEIHGEPAEGIVRLTVDNERFFGSDNVLGLVSRIEQLWQTKKLLEQSQEEGSNINIADVMPPRCSETPDKFPCSWGNGKEKCEFFNHCWNPHTQGLSIVAYESCPEEAKWELTTTDGEVVTIDSRKVPEGVTLEALQALVNMQAINLDPFIISDDTDVVAIEDAEETALNADHLFDSTGELKLFDAPLAENVPAENALATEGNKATLEQKADVADSSVPNIAIEYINDAGKKSIKCLNCKQELNYERLANGGTKKCEFCGNVNKVLRA